MANRVSTKNNATRTSPIAEQGELETDWVEATSTTLSTQPTELNVDVTSTTTSLVSSSTLTQGQEVTLVESDNSYTDGVLGAVSSSGGLVSSIDPFGDGSCIFKSTMDSAGDITTPLVGASCTVGGSETFQAGAFGNEAVFNDSDTSKIVVSTALTTIKSMSFFLTMNAITTQDRIFSHSTGNEGVDVRATEIGIKGSASTASVLTYTMPTSTRKHIVITLDGVNAKLYIDTVLTDTTAFTDTYITPINVIGHRGGISSGGLNGALDQIEFYNKTLTSTEVGVLYTQTATQYTADITSFSLSTAPTKAFLKDDTSISLAIESTPERIVNEVSTYLTVDATTDTTNLVVTEPIYEGEKLFIDDTEVTLGAVTGVLGNGVLGNVGTTITKDGDSLGATHTGASTYIDSNIYGNTPIESGNIYWEVDIDISSTLNLHVGVCANNTYQANSLTGAGIPAVAYVQNGGVYKEGTQQFTANSFTIGDIIGVRYEYSTGTIEFYKNGVSQGTISVAAETPMYPAHSHYYQNSHSNVNYVSQLYKPVGTSNYGPSYSSVAHTLTATTPTKAYRKGSKALTVTGTPTTTEIIGTHATSGLLTTGDTILLDNNKPVVTTNVVEGTALIDGPNNQFETVLYTGNGATQTVQMANITGGVDFVWAKSRNTTSNHFIQDSIRGTNSNLIPNLTNAEGTQTNYITAFNSNSFELGDYGGLNLNTNPYVAWCASLPNHTASNTAGTITSETKSNDFMSVVSYTGTGANATVGHGLSSAPELIIAKGRSSAGHWAVYNKTITATKYMNLNETLAATTNSIRWNDTEPTVDVFSVGTSANTNEANPMIAYAFTSVAGVCKVGSYTGTGASGNAVDCGFEPAWVMIKRTDTAGSWNIFDNQRGTGDLKGLLRPDTLEAEFVDNDNVAFTSTGFTMNAVRGDVNASGGTYIYLAIAKDTAQDIPKYTCTIPAQASAPTSVAVPDRTQKLTVTSKLFDGTKFNYTYGSYVKGGRAMATKLESTTSGTTVLSPITTNLNKA